MRNMKLRRCRVSAEGLLITVLHLNIYNKRKANSGLSSQNIFKSPQQWMEIKINLFKSDKVQDVGCRV